MMALVAISIEGSGMAEEGVVDAVNSNTLASVTASNVNRVKAKVSASAS